MFPTEATENQKAFLSASRTLQIQKKESYHVVV